MYVISVRLSSSLALVGSIPAIGWFRRWDIWFHSVRPRAVRLFPMPHCCCAFSFFFHTFCLFHYSCKVYTYVICLGAYRFTAAPSSFFASVIPAACGPVASLVSFVRRLATPSCASLSPLLCAPLRAPRLSLSSASSCLSLLALFETWSCTGVRELLFIAPPF